MNHLQVMLALIITNSNAFIRGKYITSFLGVKRLFNRVYCSIFTLKKGSSSKRRS